MQFLSLVICMCRIELLRKEMKKCGVNAVIIPTADPHLSEYIADEYKLREWLSGFTGSAGTLVVTEKESGLWTDGRYYIQAEKELSGSEVVLFKASEKETIKITDYLLEKLEKGETLALDGKLFSKNKLDELKDKLKKKSIHLKNDFDPSAVWKDKPERKANPCYILSEKYSGESAKDKMLRVRREMKNEGATHYVISSPQEIMWLLNIRGADVLYTPVMLSYLLIGEKEAYLYAPKENVPEDVLKYLEELEVKVKPYNGIYTDVEKLSKKCTVIADFSSANALLIDKIKCPAKDKKSIIEHMKGIKNSTEIANIKKAYIKDNTALIKSFYEIYHKDELTEWEVCDIIEKHRGALEGYISPSFDTIAAYGENAAMMHYGPTRENSATIFKKGMLLIDTGAQFFEGTTDTTRTLILGEIPEEEKENYTLVLKGNINLAETVFPKGTKCSELDSITRKPLWKKGLDYRCSTGHGVGYLLSVHEGPQRISSLCNVELEAGMTVTDEPGVYTEGKYGIRIENHLYVKEHSTTEYGEYLCFEPLGYCPIGTEYLKTELLDNEEKRYINDYNEKVNALYEDFLSAEEKKWLKAYTREI